MSELDDAREKLDREFGQVRGNLTKIRSSLEKVEEAGPEDDVHDLLKDLEDVVQEIRTGGVVGSGANGHKRALKKYRELKAAGTVT